MARPFVKMNGLGNDFVVVWTAGAPFAPGPGAARAIAARAGGIGCDQILSLEPSSRADAFMRVWNADGGEVGACGNGARCVGWLVMEAAGRDGARIDTAGGLLEVRRRGDRLVEVDMGVPGLTWRKIPLAEEMDTRRIDLEVEPGLAGPGCVSMGNPHVVFFVEDAEEAPVARVGPIVEHHPLFPERANVGFAQIKAHDRIRLKVWERGAGLTRACGTGACAALVAARRRGLTGRAATVELDGGELHIDWRRGDRHVLMTGPVAVEFTGHLPDGDYV
ncbi:MAG: diaminopimelate epimerase [Caulobacteraceae bacterium]